jgi:hypothetical protein
MMFLRWSGELQGRGRQGGGRGLFARLPAHGHRGKPASIASRPCIASWTPADDSPHPVGDDLQRTGLARGDVLGAGGVAGLGEPLAEAGSVGAPAGCSRSSSTGVAPRSADARSRQAVQDEHSGTDEQPAGRGGEEGRARSRHWCVILFIVAWSWECACAACASLLSASSAARLGLSTLACAAEQPRRGGRAGKLDARHHHCSIVRQSQPQPRLSGGQSGAPQSRDGAH